MMAFFTWLLGEIGSMSLSALTNASVEYLGSRKKYLRDVIRGIEDSKTDLLLCINTLTSRESSNSIRQLQDSLESQQSSGLRVRVLVSTSKESYIGAYELFQKGIPIKFVPEDISQHLNFTIIDSNYCILSIKDEKGSSKGAIRIKDVALNGTLTKTFETIWNNSKTLYFYEFIIRKINEIRKYELIDTKTIASKFTIPIGYIERLLSKFPIYIFLIGRPGSGKSSIGEILKQYFRDLNFTKDDITYIDDYFILREWSMKDGQGLNFERVEPDGFRILNRDIYRECEKEINKRILNLSTRINIIEFSRNSYEHFFSNISEKIMSRSIIVYVEASVNRCLIRNLARKYSSELPTKYVPEDVIIEQYSIDDFETVLNKFSTVFCLDNENNVDPQVRLLELINNKLSTSVT